VRSSFFFSWNNENRTLPSLETWLSVSRFFAASEKSRSMETIYMGSDLGSTQCEGTVLINLDGLVR